MTDYLVFQLARFGDLVQTKRLLLSLAALSDIRVHLVVDRSLGGLARRIYPFTLVHEMCCHGGNRSEAEVLAENAAVFAELKSLHPERVFTLNFSGLSFAISSLFDPDTVRGYKRANGQNLRSRWCRMALHWTGQRRISPLNLEDFWAYFADAPIAPDQVNPHALPAGAGEIGVVVAGREARRSLPLEVLLPCLEGIWTALGGPRVSLIGSGSERLAARRLIRHASPALSRRIRDLSGQTTLEDLVDIFSGLDAVVSPDTGAMHLAAHVGTPVRAFFLSSAWVFETGPYGEGHRIWQAARSCAPCLESAPCPYAVSCLRPFAEAKLRTPAGRAGDWPENLVEMESALDALGVTYRPVRGEYAEDVARLRARTTLAGALGLAYGTPDPSISGQLMRESDWILPNF